MISLFASSVRHHLWDEFMISLQSNQQSFYEVVFAGNLDKFQVRPYLKKYPNLKYIHTGDIKPAQCYEIARRNCSGELVMWVADDCEFSDGLIYNLIGKWMEIDNDKAIISVKTNEDGKNNDLNDHRFFGGNVNTPLMAPLGVMNRQYLDILGGLDRRYLCGQYENDIVMRVLEDGGEVIKYEEGCVFINHLEKHGKGTNFWTGYEIDRTVLENSWVIGGYKHPDKPFNVFNPFFVEGEKKVVRYYPVTNREVSKKRLDLFCAYEDKDLLTVNQIPGGKWK